MGCNWINRAACMRVGVGTGAASLAAVQYPKSIESTCPDAGRSHLLSKLIKFSLQVAMGCQLQHDPVGCSITLI
jgi:hypothetical protein